MRQPFITPAGKVVLAKLWQPYLIGGQSIWLADVEYAEPLRDLAPNHGGGYRFIGLTGPAIYDGKGKPLNLSGEVGAGSLVRVSGQSWRQSRRLVLTLKAVSIVELIETGNPFILTA